MKKWKIIIVFSIFIVGGCRYMNEDKSFTLDEVEVSIIEYMENKYGQEFELIDIGYNSIISKEVNARVIAKNDKLKNEITVNWFYENEKELLTDDYTYLLYKDEVNKLMDPMILNNFSEYEYTAFSIITGDGVPIEKYEQDIPLSEIAKENKITISTKILLKEGDVEDSKIENEIVNLYEELKTNTTNDVHFSINIYICKTDVYYENEQLIQQFKKLYSMDVSNANFTYNDGIDEKPLRSFWFTSNNLEDGVRVR
ncbi:hypothetical protein [Breznakia pachnodae]|uniref:Lipoprotein n=1 Tax=Breznakia pachnodae TaxID=265178 RepID=A0ABU0DZ18_9FIRM|nr:hypothetical protein [Breznakia pachnodae]MDQ0359894.1 hypothetical protein [Breznakia pachnodae]